MGHSEIYVETPDGVLAEISSKNLSHAIVVNFKNGILDISYGGISMLLTDGVQSFCLCQDHENNKTLQNT